MAPTIAQVQNVVCKVFYLTPLEFQGRVRSPNVTDARWAVFFLCRKFTGKPANVIARETGFDRSTVSYALRGFEERLAERKKFKVRLAQAVAELDSYRNDTWPRFGCYRAEVRI